MGAPLVKVRTFDANGFAIYRSVLALDTIEILREAIGAVIRDEPVKPFGVRFIARRCEAVAELSKSPEIRSIVASLIARPFQLVRSIFFDKLPDSNWHVGWHQDLSITVKERPNVELPGFTGWTVKDGVTHVQAPGEVLDEMVTLRIHLDDAPEENGPLRVIPRSHANGRLSARRIEEWIGQGEVVTCEVEAGDVLVMRPQLLHASHKSSGGLFLHRRVVHLEFAPVAVLPPELRWAED